jgi:hypothetical protein
MRVTLRGRLRLRATRALLLLATATCGACASGDDPLSEDDPDATVAVEAPGPRQIRLLTRSEYDATVHDLLSLEPLSAEVSECEDLGDCAAEEASCVGGVCVVDPCNLSTFIFPAAAGQHGSVVVAGSFNGWGATAAAGGWPLAYEPSLEAWVAKHEVADGTHSYKFVVDGATWLADPQNPMTEPDGFGGVNSVLEVSCADAPPDAPAPSSPESFVEDFPVESRPEKFPFDNAAEAGLVTAVHAEQYFRAARRIADLASLDLEGLLGCAPVSSEEPCVTTFVERFARRAFRRPLLADEAERLTAMARSQTTAADGVRLALRVILQSPNFLYRSEVGAPIGGDGGAARLEPWEVASLLSYSYWGSMPDETLLDAIESGELEGPEDYAREARRLLSDGRARARMGVFASQWLGVEGVVGVDKGNRPDFDRELSEMMADETRDFVSSVIFDGGAFEDLFVADRTAAAPRLRAFYGADDAGLLPEGRRAGLLAHGSVLATYAHSDQTSPVRRGLFVRTRLMCMELGAPPANAGAVPEVDPESTTRQRFEQHSSDGTCASCHQHIDPIGFGFEHFDPAGRVARRGGRPANRRLGRAVLPRRVGRRRGDHDLQHVARARPRARGLAAGPSLPRPPSAPVRLRSAGARGRRAHPRGARAAVG